MTSPVTYTVLEELTVNFAYVPKSGHWPTGLPTGLYTLANKISTEKTILTLVPTHIGWTMNIEQAAIVFLYLGFQSQ